MRVETDSYYLTKRASKLLPITSAGKLLLGVRAIQDKRGGNLDLIGGCRSEKDCCRRGTAMRESGEEIGFRPTHSDLHEIGRDPSPSGRTEVTGFWFPLPDEFVPDLRDGELATVIAFDPLEAYSLIEHDGQRDMIGKLLWQVHGADLRQLVVAQPEASLTLVA